MASCGEAWKCKRRTRTKANEGEGFSVDSRKLKIESWRQRLSRRHGRRLRRINSLNFLSKATASTVKHVSRIGQTRCFALSRMQMRGSLLGSCKNPKNPRMSPESSLQISTPSVRISLRTLAEADYSKKLRRE